MRAPLKWLERELPDMERLGLVQPDQSRRILDYYRKQQPEGSRGLLYVLFGVLGALLIGGGLILIIAHNWPDLSRPARTAISLTPLLLTQILAGWVVYARMDSTAWRESVAVIWTLSIGAAIALVAQTYHMPGDFDSFMLTWMLLTLPVVYLLRASTSLLIFLAGITSWAISAQNVYGEANAYWLLILTVLPLIIYWNKSSPFAASATLARWGLFISVFLGVMVILDFRGDFLRSSMFILYASILYLVGSRYEAGAPSVWQKPGLVIGGLGVAVCVYVFTWLWYWEDVYHGRSIVEAFMALKPSGRLVYTAIILVYLVYLGFAVNSRRVLSLVWGLFPVIFLGCCLWLEKASSPMPGVWVMNILLFTAGVLTLMQGMKTGHLGRINAGMLVMSALILTRFFDGNFSTLVRAVIFIAMGIAFLGVNVRMMKRRREVRP